MYKITWQDVHGSGSMGSLGREDVEAQYQRYTQLDDTITVSVFKYTSKEEVWEHVKTWFNPDHVALATIWMGKANML
jgi:hypothetical protein